MTRIIFIFKNIIHFFASEKLLTILILSGMVICDVIFLVFGNVFWSDAKALEYQAYENNIVTFGFDALDIDEFLSQTSGKDYITSTFFTCTESGEDGEPIILSAYEPPLEMTNSRIVLGHGLTGTGSEFVMSSNYANRRNFSDLPRIKKGDTVRFFDSDWTCSGIVRTSSADNFDILINMADFQSHVKTNMTANFRYQNGTSLMEIQNFSNELKHQFDAQYVLIPSKTVTISFSEFMYDMSGTFILLMIAVINDMFLYRFLLAKRTYTYGIYKLYGMDNRFTLMTLCVEMLVFLIVSYLAGVLLYSVGMCFAGNMSSMLQHLPEFGFSFLVIAVLNLLFFGLTAGKIVRNSPVELMKESVVS